MKSIFYTLVTFNYFSILSTFSIFNILSTFSIFCTFNIFSVFNFPESPDNPVAVLQCAGASNTNDSSLSHALSSHYSILLHIGNEVLLLFFCVNEFARFNHASRRSLVRVTEQFDEIFCFVFVYCLCSHQLRQY